jgi:hypothetical protein
MGSGFRMTQDLGLLLIIEAFLQKGSGQGQYGVALERNLNGFKSFSVVIQLTKHVYLMR